MSVVYFGFSDNPDAGTFDDKFTDVLNAGVIQDKFLRFFSLTDVSSSFFESTFYKTYIFSVQDVLSATELNAITKESKYALIDSVLLSYIGAADKISNYALGDASVADEDLNTSKISITSFNDVLEGAILSRSNKISKNIIINDTSIFSSIGQYKIGSSIVYNYGLASTEQVITKDTYLSPIDDGVYLKISHQNTKLVDGYDINIGLESMDYGDFVKNGYIDCIDDIELIHNTSILKYSDFVAFDDLRLSSIVSTSKVHTFGMFSGHAANSTAGNIKISDICLIDNAKEDYLLKAYKASTQQIQDFIYQYINIDYTAVGALIHTIKFSTVNISYSLVFKSNVITTQDMPNDIKRKVKL